MPKTLEITEGKNTGAIVLEARDSYGKLIPFKNYYWNIEAKKLDDDFSYDALYISQNPAIDTYRGVYEIKALKQGDYEIILSFKTDMNDLHWTVLKTEKIEVGPSILEGKILKVSTDKDTIFINSPLVHLDRTDIHLEIKDLNQKPCDLNLGPLEFVIFYKNKEIESLKAINLGGGKYQAKLFVHEAKDSPVGEYEIKIRNKKGFLPSIIKKVNVIGGDSYFPTTEQSIMYAPSHIIQKGDNFWINFSPYSKEGKLIPFDRFTWMVRAEEPSGGNWASYKMEAYFNTTEPYKPPSDIWVYAKVSGFVNVAVYYGLKGQRPTKLLKYISLNIYS